MTERVAVIVGGASGIGWATAQALAGVLVRGLDSGAFGIAELQNVAAGIDRDVLRGLLDRSVTVPLG